jgi:hypothetical protein
MPLGRCGFKGTPFFSLDVRKIRFIIRKDPRKTNRDLFGAQLAESLENHPLDSEALALCNEAKGALAFSGTIPKFQLRSANAIKHKNATGLIQTAALAVHCDRLHVAFLNRLFTGYYEEGLCESSSSHAACSTETIQPTSEPAATLSSFKTNVFPKSAPCQ